MTEIYLGYPPENIKNWILAHSAPIAKTPVWGEGKWHLTGTITYGGTDKTYDLDIPFYGGYCYEYDEGSDPYWEVSIRESEDKYGFYTEYNDFYFDIDPFDFSKSRVVFPAGTAGDEGVVAKTDVILTWISDEEGGSAEQIPTITSVSDNTVTGSNLTGCIATVSYETPGDGTQSYTVPFTVNDAGTEGTLGKYGGRSWYRFAQDDTTGGAKLTISNSAGSAEYIVNDDFDNI